MIPAAHVRLPVHDPPMRRPMGAGVVINMLTDNDARANDPPPVWWWAQAMTVDGGGADIAVRVL